MSAADSQAETTASFTRRRAGRSSRHQFIDAHQVGSAVGVLQRQHAAGAVPGDMEDVPAVTVVRDLRQPLSGHPVLHDLEVDARPFPRSVRRTSRVSA